MNRLGKEKSPYLLQHADNPVDWYPWCDEAFERAVNEDKPVLLSIGYSSCHWCHVMAHECFENIEIAEIMNSKFINIKVDREERPDIDDIYMQAVQSLTGRGGWPLTAILMPDGRPFFGGTYFPPVEKMGLPSLPDVLNKVYDAYKNRREELIDTAVKVQEILSTGPVIGQPKVIGSDGLAAVFKQLVKSFDWKYGGFGGAPKFPSPMALEFMMRHHLKGDEQDSAMSLKMVNFTLSSMAMGGIYDQAGGGFHRYSVDEKWLVPHFEKMLYDNAQLSRSYLYGWQLTGNSFFRNISEDINDYILREMCSPDGTFYSASDADSEGVEGKFFVWSVDELKAAVGEDYNLLSAFWGIDRGPNFEGSNILFIAGKIDDIALKHKLTEEELFAKVKSGKEKLYKLREGRVKPGVDKKVISSWNGLMIAALAEGGRGFEREDYVEAAVRAGKFFMDRMRTDDGGLYRVYMEGAASIRGYLEDYANIIDAMIELYQATSESSWLVTAVELAEYAAMNFRDDKGTFYDSGRDHEKLFIRPRNVQDNALPSGNSKIAKQFLKLAVYTGKGSYFDFAEDIIKSSSEYILRYPLAFSEALNTASMLLDGLAEVVISGERDNPVTKEMLSLVNSSFTPDLVTAFKMNDNREAVESLKNIPFNSRETAAFVCRNLTCSEPVKSMENLKKLLNIS